MLDTAAQDAEVPSLDDTLSELSTRSPALGEALERARARGWVVAYGQPGGGTFADAHAPVPTVTIDPEDATDPAALASALAHEVGHAVDEEPEHHWDESMTRDQYVDANTREMLRGEAEATIMELRVRDELAAGEEPVDLPISGATAEQKIALWEQFQAGDITRDELVEGLSDLFATGEHPSNEPDATYGDYYARPFEEGWDRAHAPSE